MLIHFSGKQTLSLTEMEPEEYLELNFSYLVTRRNIKDDGDAKL